MTTAVFISEVIRASIFLCCSETEQVIDCSRPWWLSRSQRVVGNWCRSGGRCTGGWWGCCLWPQGVRVGLWLRT
jgi:hypothetical protein